MEHSAYLAFIDELEKIANFNQQQIRQQGAQMVQQGQMMIQNPIGAMAQIRQQAALTANNPAARPRDATQMASLLQSTRPGLSKVAMVQVSAFIDELETAYGYEFDEQTKEAMFGTAAKLLSRGAGAVKNVAANPMLAMNNATVKVMSSPGMQTLVHNPALGTAVMGHQLAGGVGQALLGRGAATAMQSGAKLLPGAAGRTVGSVGTMLGHVV